MTKSDTREARRKRIKALRLKAKLTQVQAASLIGKSYHLIRLWESGGGEPYSEYEAALDAVIAKGAK
jgi:DNA-binding transcriptional regulator YiaG